MKKLILVLIGLAVVSGGYLFFLRKPSRLLPSFTAKDAADKTEQASRFLREKGEEGLKQKQYLPLIRVYENLLVKYPDNNDLKKKLADLYDRTGQHEKAETLLKQKAPPP
ncbi:MAG: tetratricopeptide repeat protein [Deltaproteobacteria bacterium]|nr:tetratricopeptide repeat protein [Deltaproteobacteria bacterium]